MAARPVFVVDTSVVVKWFSDEELVDEALTVRSAYADDEIDIYVPDLLLYELSNALRYNPRFDSDDVAAAVRSVLDMELGIVTPTEDLFESAIRIAIELDGTVYDATYVALAEVLRTRAITTDEDIADHEHAVHLAEF